MNRKLVKKILVVVVGIAIVTAFKLFALDQYLTLSYIKESREQFVDLYRENQATVIAAYMAVYIAVTALSLPGATVLTLAGGGLFGFWTGLIIVSFASTIGATIACAVSRFLLRDWVDHRFGDKLAAVNEGIKQEGAFYLFTLRLVPLFPFFVINLVCGLTKLGLPTFYWVSQLGMLPGTMVYVNAGREIAKIDSLSGILSPGLIASFAILGLFPITAKKIIAWYRSRARRRQ